MNSGEKKTLFKVFGVLGLIVFFLLALFLLSPIKIGLVTMSRGESIARYLGIIADNRNDSQLVEALKSENPREQVVAMTYMATGEKSSKIVTALLKYIKDTDVHISMKEIAIWALGELKAEQAKEYLISLLNDMSIDQYELNKAIQKIDGEYTWSKRISNQGK